MHQSFISMAVWGQGWRGSSEMIWAHHHPRSAVERRGFWFHAQTCRSNDTFTCQDLGRAFSRTSKMSLQCWACTRSLHREKSKSPLFPGSIGAVVTNDLCITYRPICKACYTPFGYLQGCSTDSNHDLLIWPFIMVLFVAGLTVCEEAAQQCLWWTFTVTFTFFHPTGLS